MGTAVWLFLAQAEWYFPCILSPLSAGPLTWVPSIGIVALLAGIILGIKAGRPSLLLFGLLAFASHLFVAVAGFFRGAIHESNMLIVCSFLLLQLAAAVYLVYRLKGVRLSATLLALFTLSYAWFAAFIASMSFNDTWL